MSNTRIEFNPASGQKGFTLVGRMVITGTCSSTVGTQTTHAHGCGKAPITYAIRSKMGGVVYEGAAPDTTNIYLKSTLASCTFEAVLWY